MTRWCRLIVVSILVGWSSCLFAQAPPFDQAFLHDPGKLAARTSGGLNDYVWSVPDMQARFGSYPNGLYLDSPEVLVSADSDYRGGKPEDLAQVAAMMRDALADRLKTGGYKLADKPGAGVLVFRIAVTDLRMKKKKRGLLAYTPIGAVVKVGADALREMMDKVDITGMTMQAELQDGQTGEVLAAIAVIGDPSGKRLEFDELKALVDEYGERARCRLDNARVPAAQQVDCLDPKARAARSPLPAP